MTPNTTYFADFIKGARVAANLTQDNLHDRGATYRQLQGRVENGEPTDLEHGMLAGYDRAYGWPRGYAQAVARVGAYATGAEVPPALLGYARADQPEPEGWPPNLTLASLCEPGRYSASAAIGFSAEHGHAVYLTYGVLTNLAFPDLAPVLNSRSGTVLLDTQVLDERSVSELDTTVHRDGARPRTFYRLAADEGPLAQSRFVVTPIALDTLTDITRLYEARQLAQALLEMFPAAGTTVERAAFTFLAVAAFGEDPFTTIRQLLNANGEYLKAHEFLNFWASFCERCDVSQELAANPDLDALHLLDGLSRAREAAKAIDIGGPPMSRAQRSARPDLPQTVRVLMLTDADEQRDNIIFYDSTLAPQTPVCFNIIAGGATLAIYRVRDGQRLTQLSSPLAIYRSIGVAPHADDLALVAQHRIDRVETLTNKFGPYAILCESGRATVVWMPGK